MQNALQTLHDTITNKRHQRNWNKALEQVREGLGCGWQEGTPLPGVWLEAPSPPGWA